MDNKVIVSIFAISALIFLGSLLNSAPVNESTIEKTTQKINRSQSVQFLPWQIETTAQGSIRVFGMSLGESTLQDAEDLYHGGAEVSLFVSPDGHYKIEAYFDKVILGGFSAQMVMTMALAQEQQAAMFRRGVRVSNLGGGRQKVTLASEDLHTVFATPIASLVYLTRARLDDELLRKRFGEPAQRLREAKHSTTHWLYPKLGLDVAVSDEGRAVLQYISPTQFAKLMAPLLQAVPQQ